MSHRAIVCPKNIKALKEPTKRVMGAKNLLIFYISSDNIKNSPMS